MTDATYPDWDAVYRDNVTWVYRLMYSKVGNQPDAEDLTAEVFMTALKPLRVSATVPEVRKYLKMTARTVLASYWRDRMGREITTIEDDLPDESSGRSSSDAPDRVRRCWASCRTTTVASWNSVSCRLSRFARRQGRWVLASRTRRCCSIGQYRWLRRVSEEAL